MSQAVGASALGEHNEFVGYCCPGTEVPLLEDGRGNLVARNSDLSYPVTSGIPNFCKHQAAESPEDALRLEVLNRSATEHGWRSAVGNHWPEVLNYVTDEIRLRLIDILPLDASQCVLEIGCGLGQFTIPIANRVRHVSAIEVVLGQALFTRTRCAQNGISNVDVVCGGDDLRLPYSCGRFDGVVINLVFEWCGNRQDTSDFESAQIEYLREIGRVLKPNGFIFIATKNRYALQYLLGGRDEHTGFRFGNALPRWLMHWLLSRRQKKRVPAGMLHSFQWWIRQLKAAGFTAIEPLWAVPEMRFPDQYVPLAPNSVRMARRSGSFRQGDTRRTSLLMGLIPARFVRHLTRGHCFVARKVGTILPK